MNYDTTRRPGRRVAAMIASGVLAVTSLGFLGTGGALLWADSKADEQGYISTGTDRFNTSTRALATENLDLDLGGPESMVDDGELGKIRVRAESNDGKPVFVGIARASDVTDYLRGSSHAIITDVEYEPFDADYSTRDGDRRLAPPANQDFWAATAQGDGEQALTWDVDDGDWSVVVMNADGSYGVDAGISAGVRLAWLDEAGWISSGTGLVLLALAGGLVFGGRRQRPDDPKPFAPRSVAGSSSTTSSSGAQ
jgi:hypothetical protein